MTCEVGSSPALIRSQTTCYRDYAQRNAKELDEALKI
jgi:hypothetical protein